MTLPNEEPANRESLMESFMPWDASVNGEHLNASPKSNPRWSPKNSEHIDTGLAFWQECARNAHFKLFMEKPEEHYWGCFRDASGGDDGALAPTQSSARWGTNHSFRKSPHLAGKSDAAVAQQVEAVEGQVRELRTEMEERMTRMEALLEKLASK